MVQTMLKLVTSHEPIFRVASKTESMGHICWGGGGARLRMLMRLVRGQVSGARKRFHM